jgi:hypothetical protein
MNEAIEDCLRSKQLQIDVKSVLNLNNHDGFLSNFDPDA